MFKRDNVNVHRAAANIIVSKSRAARGSVCNVLLSRGYDCYGDHKSDQLTKIATSESSIKYTAGIRVVFDEGLKIMPANVTNTPNNGADGIILDRSTIAGEQSSSATNAMNSKEENAIIIQSANPNSQLQRRSVGMPSGGLRYVCFFSSMFLVPYALFYSALKHSMRTTNRWLVNEHRQSFLTLIG